MYRAKLRLKPDYIHSANFEAQLLRTAITRKNKNKMEGKLGLRFLQQSLKRVKFGLRSLSHVYKEGRR